MPAGTTGGRATVPIDASQAAGSLTLASTGARAAANHAVITTLSEADTRALEARLEPLPDLSAGNAVAPALRPASPPPPRTGEVQPIAFEVARGRAVADAPVAPSPPVRPLAPPQISPQGEVVAESEVRIRFDEAMVPVAKVGEVASPPATITPAVAGTWRWIDTRVLELTSANARFPGATELKVSVPVGVRALSGNTLIEATQASFTTPALAITGTFPTTELRPDSAIAIRFNQDFDPDRVVPLLRVETSRGAALAFRVVDLAEARERWARNPSLWPLPAELASHAIVIAPTSTWPAGVTHRIALARKAPSREGPRLSTGETDARFAVVPPFSVLGVRCGDAARPRPTGAVCPARGYLDVMFANPIEPASYHASKVQIDGLPEVDNEPSDDAVGLHAPEAAGRAFAISVGDGIVDRYGQALVGPRRIAFTTGPEQFDPFLNAPSGLIVLDPRFQIPQWVVRTAAVSSVRVRLYQVQPKDYFAYEAYEAGRANRPPGKPILDRTYPVGARSGADLRVDLRPALNAAGLGHVIAIASVVLAPGQPALETIRAVAWLQVTRLGVSARIDGDHVNAWVDDIAPAHFLAPVAGATAALLIDGRDPPAAPVVTTADGHATVDLLPPAPNASRHAAVLEVTTATDSTFTAIDRHTRAIREHDARWYVTDDRFTYKPGEKVYVKGWVRWSQTGINPDIAVPPAGELVTYTLADVRNNQLATGIARLTEQGGFDLEVELPANANLGTAKFTFSSKAGKISHPIEIQEFRTPAYAVTLNDDVSHGGVTPVVLGETLEMTAAAKYYAGGGLPGATIAWDATLSAAAYQPPGWDDYSFSPARPRSQRGSYGDRGWPGVEAHQTASLSGDSTASVTLGIAALPHGRPSVLNVDATVSDVDRMRIRASSRAILVHPSNYYVGIRARPQTSDVLELVVTDIDGNVVRGVPINVAIEGVLGSERYRDDATPVDRQGCKLASAAAPVTCSFQRRDVKTAYTAFATIADPRGRTNTSELAIPWSSFDDSTGLMIVPDRHGYKPGDVARLAIHSAVVPATAVVSFARQGVIAQRRIELTGESTTVELPIEPAYIQNVHVLVDRVARKQHPEPGSSLPLPEHVTAELDIPVDIESARLVMTARSTQPLVEPGAMATFEVAVRRAGKPVPGAEVALMVVDEAVLALSARTFGDPLPAFYRTVESGATAQSSLWAVQDAGPALDGDPGFHRYALDSVERGPGGTGSGTMGGSSYGTIGHGSGGGVVTARKDFRANAVFAPRLETDAQGRAQITVKMPDSLTRFRIVALAAAGGRYFGKAESTLVTQRKVNARTIAPRFLNQGDTFSLPVVIQNLDTQPRTVDVAVRAANLGAIGPRGKRVVVPAGERAEVRFELATRARGRAAIQTIATSGQLADASTVTIPIYAPATTESYATYGTVDAAPRFEQLAVPADIFTDVGGVDVELASTQLQSLTDAFWYLYQYPFECAEQRSARMLATSAIHDILDAFAAPGRPSKDEIAATAAHDVAVLAGDQLADGGWGYFPGMRSDPFVTMQVLSALAGAHAPGKPIARAVAYVTRLATSLVTGLERTAATPPARRTDGATGYNVALAATALSALAAAGQDVHARAERLHAAATALATYPIDARARLLAVLAGRPGDRAIRAGLLADLLSATHETAASATVAASYEEAERLLLVSSTRTSALVLDAVIREAPDRAIITKLARGVLEARRRGRWPSTQDNLVALCALRRYFDVYEAKPPSYTGKLWLGTAAYAEQSFVGRTTARGEAHVGWPSLPAGSVHDLALAKDGPGRMYYRVGITYAPKSTDLPAVDAGFIVRRGYTAIDDPGDVVRLGDGRWKIRLGARVLVTVETVTTATRYSVAVADPLPAGLESVNDALAVAERSVAQAPDTHWDFRNLRDDRSEVFAMELSQGHHRFSYTARATTPGTFLAAPAKAEAMYAPETFGRSTGEIVVVE